MFWIETVEFTIEVPIFEPGQPPLIIPAQTGAAGQPVPEFLVNPPVAITKPRPITVKSPQIQYSQQVLLNFNGLSWPHVSVATPVPASPLPGPGLGLYLMRSMVTLLSSRPRLRAWINEVALGLE